MSCMQPVARKQSDSLANYARNSCAGSVLVHVLALTVLAAIPMPLLMRATGGNSQRSMLVLELQESEQQDDPKESQSTVIEQSVVIKPNAALVKGQQMVATKSAKLKLQDLLPAQTRTADQHSPQRRSQAEIVDTSDLMKSLVSTKRRQTSKSAEKTTKPSKQKSQKRKRRKRVFEVAGKAPEIAPDFSSSQPPFSNQPPAYPSLALERGWTGTVILRIWVDAAGKVTKVAVAKSSSYRILDAAAVGAVKMWRGKPAMRNGRAIATVRTMPVKFAP